MMHRSNSLLSMFAFARGVFRLIPVWLQCILLAHLSVGTCLAGQSKASRVAHPFFKQLTTEDGLPSGIIYDIFEDSRGWIWIGTDGGLARLDGKRFRAYRPDGRPGDLGANFINKIIEDKDGRIWVSGWGAGLQLYDPLTDRFRSFRHAVDDPASLPSDNPQDLLVDHKGQLWVGTFGGGIARLEADGQHFERIPSGAPGEVDPRVWLMKEDRDGKIWVGTWGGLYRFDPDDYSWEPIADDRKLIPPFDRRILYVQIDSTDQLWIGTWGGMYRVNCAQDVDRVDCHDFHFDRLTNHAVPPHRIPSGAVWHIEEVEPGRLWFADDEGIGEYRLGDHSIRRMPLEDSNFPVPIRTLMFAIEPSANGTVWFGGVHPSLFYYNASASIFSNFINDENGQSLGLVTKITFTEDGRIWIVNGGGTLFVAQVDDLSFRKVDVGNIDNGMIIQARPLRDRGLLLTVEGRGAWKMDVDSLEAVRLKIADPPSGFELDNLTMAVELPNRKIWLASLDGVLEVDPDTGKSRKIQAISGGGDLLSGTIQNAMVIDEASHRVLVGMQNKGLISIDWNDGSFLHYRHDKDDPSSLNSDYVRDIAIDESNNIWAATTMGIARIDAKTGKLSRVNVQPSISRLASYCIVADSRGGIIFSIPAIGIGRFDPDRNEVATYSSASGMGSGVSSYANCEVHGDEVFIGRPFGLTVMNTSRIEEKVPDTVSDVSIVDIESEHLHALLDAAGRPAPAWNAETILIGSSDGEIRLHLAALGHLPDWNGQIGYRIFERGRAEKSWSILDIPWGTLSLPSLPAGNYVLQLRSRDPNHYWGPVLRQINLRILPKYYETWWFAAIIVILTIVSLVRGHLWWSRRMEARQVELRNAVRERSHELLEANRMLEQLASTDPLTGVCNRRTILDRAATLIEEAKTNGSHMTILFCDVDHFKEYNDSRGHLKGDEALIRIGEALTSTLDRLGHGFVGRVGGEEFVVLLTHRDILDLKSTADCFIDAVFDLRIPHPHLGSGRYLTISIGGASSEDGHMGLTELLEIADTKLYEAKRTGRARSVV